MMMLRESLAITDGFRVYQGTGCGMMQLLLLIEKRHYVSRIVSFLAGEVVTELFFLLWKRIEDVFDPSMQQIVDIERPFDVLLGEGLHGRILGRVQHLLLLSELAFSLFLNLTALWCTVCVYFTVFNCSFILAVDRVLRVEHLKVIGHTRLHTHIASILTLSQRLRSQDCRRNLIDKLLLLVRRLNHWLIVEHAATLRRLVRDGVEVFLRRFGHQQLLGLINIQDLFNRLLVLEKFWLAVPSLVKDVMDATPIGVAIGPWVQVHLRAVYVFCCGFGHFFDTVTVGFGQLTQLLLHLLVRGRGAIFIVWLLLCRRSGGYHIVLLLFVALWLA